MEFDMTASCRNEVTAKRFAGIKKEKMHASSDGRKPEAIRPIGFTGLPMPSPGTSFSLTANERCVEAINVVRSGVARPRKMDRPASISSVASTISTSP